MLGAARASVTPCPVCHGERGFAFSHLLLGKHPCDYFFCTHCGLLQTQEPYWLDDAYASAIGTLDTGILKRNIRLSKQLSLLLLAFSSPGDKHVDAAGGYGILTRLMRDNGFDCYWTDKYCANLFAQGFEATSCAHQTTSAFEVLEHVIDPVGFVSGLLEKTGSSTVFLSTELFEGQPPAPAEWWYYAFGGGQHISFYQKRTLQVIADKLRMRFIPGRSIHVLTKRKMPPAYYRCLSSPLMAELASPLIRMARGSRTMSDHATFVS